jgi:hypothetical protein
MDHELEDQLDQNPHLVQRPAPSEYHEPSDHHDYRERAASHNHYEHPAPHDHHERPAPQAHHTPIHRRP